jgi:hypothetical protein
VSTEAGILEMDEREKSGRLKVARHLSDYLEERRFYHRKDGQIVKLKDDLMSAVRIAIMAKRFARAVAKTEEHLAHAGAALEKAKAEHEAAAAAVDQAAGHVDGGEDAATG